MVLCSCIGLQAKHGSTFLNLKLCILASSSAPTQLSIAASNRKLGNKATAMLAVPKNTASNRKLGEAWEQGYSTFTVCLWHHRYTVPRLHHIRVTVSQMMQCLWPPCDLPVTCLWFFDPPTIDTPGIDVGHVSLVPSRAGWVCKFDDIGSVDHTDVVLL